jgi:CDGSH-type Zn-finger protein/uncharacterized Fe-S cluster protein YjdI
MSTMSREQLLHSLYEAAELEHTLMCTYLYAAWSLKDAGDGLPPERAAVLAEWKQDILRVAIEEMSHLVSVWNITSALGGAPRIGRFNFPLDPGALPASITVRLTPFNRNTLQHFIFLERPACSDEPDGEGFPLGRTFSRGNSGACLTPMPEDYATVGAFYASLEAQLSAFVAEHGEDQAFCGDAGLQLSGPAIGLPHAKSVICKKTALAAFEAIVAQGEGATEENTDSHYCRFLRVRQSLDALAARDPDFVPAHPAATNPVLRAPPRPEGRVWIEDADAIATVDLANAAYGLMLRVLAYVYAVPAADPRKQAMLQLSLGLMRAISPLAEAASRMPAGPSNPGCNAGMSFTALRDSAALPPGAAADRFVRERLQEFTAGATKIAHLSPRHAPAAQLLAQLAAQLDRQLPDPQRAAPKVAAGTTTAAAGAPQGAGVPGVEVVASEEIEIHYAGKRCIHARHCVTGAPTVFLANVKGPWIHPETMPVERLVDIAHACPSGAIAYRRLDGEPEEPTPPVNLIAIREAGPLAFRADLVIAGKPAGYRATLCRCGASNNKPYCDGSHKEIGFAASGEPATKVADALAQRNGALAIDPQPNGPLQVTGNLEITAGTGRIVARVTAARLCRCGGSQDKPFCDGTHARNGFRAD